MKKLTGFLVIATVLIGCGPAADNGDEATDENVILIRPVLNQMLFEQTEIRVTAGETYTLVFDNIDPSPAMSHNWVLLESRDIIDDVGTAALAAGAAAEYIPDHDGILAYTPMAAPTERVEVRFTAPPAGEYPYICTYPGHYTIMQGTLYSE